MIFLRLFISVLMIVGSGFFCLDILERAFAISNVVKVDGVLNIWGVYGSFLIGVYGLVYWLGQLIDLPFPVGNFTKPILVLAIVISPLLTVGTYAKVHSEISDYVECTDLRKLSSRYSSHTYAVSEELCQQALEEKAKRRR